MLYHHRHHHNDAGVLTVVVGPTDEPLSLDEAKLHLRIDSGYTDDDALIGSLITAARQRIEIETSRTLCTQTMTLAVDRFPRGCGHIGLRRPPIQSVSGITYVDADGTAQTLDPSVYRLILAEPARIELAYGKSWPTSRYQSGAVTITFIAGFGDASSVPELAKAAMRLIVGHLYENREEVTTSRSNQPFELPQAVTSIVGLLSWGNYQ